MDPRAFLLLAGLLVLALPGSSAVPAKKMPSPEPLFSGAYLGKEN